MAKPRVVGGDFVNHCESFRCADEPEHTARPGILTARVADFATIAVVAAASPSGGVAVSSPGSALTSNYACCHGYRTARADGITGTSPRP